MIKTGLLLLLILSFTGCFFPQDPTVEDDSIVLGTETPIVRIAHGIPEPWEEFRMYAYQDEGHDEEGRYGRSRWFYNNEYIRSGNTYCLPAGIHLFQVDWVYDDGEVKSRSFVITIETPDNYLPEPALSASPIYPKVGETVTFNASGSSDPARTIVEYSWDFGDGNTARGISTQNRYSQAGNYTVELTVTDNQGGEASAHLEITVGDAL